ncbi:DUF551 domain-containing protein [Hafnia alvei]|uniref:DUF551 domain-containing protein n=1 Tax=Hafnia alvei TaxID=569 RepID=A0A1C6Z578_HAFAL|nr:DUF551 domain-containing protein [Hafnia alvei]SCM54234.1 Protein of unknown function (DUF551) [Hafnia alvei]
MSELTTERLEKRIKNCIEVGNSCVMLPVSVAEALLAFRKAAEKLVRCKGRYHSEQNYRALAALFGVTVPDLPPLPSDEASIIPVSEHKWINVDEGMPENYNTVLVCSNRGIIWCAEVEDGDFYPDEFPNLPREGFEITHWMPLPAAPVQEQNNG